MIESYNSVTNLDVELNSEDSEDFVILSDVRYTISRLNKQFVELNTKFNDIVEDYNINKENIDMILTH